MNPALLEIADFIEKNPFESSGHMYHPLPFPEFQRLKTSSLENAAVRKWRLIAAFLDCLFPVQGGTILDVGANAGYYSFRMAQCGARVEAYEPHAHYADIGRRIVDATGLPVCWHNKELQSSDLRDKRYDVALMLSVFQWMSRGNQNLSEANELLRLVASSSRYLFFELGCNQGKSAITTSELPLAWVWNMLVATTAPKKVAYLGSTTVWRGIRRFLFVCYDVPGKLTAWQQIVTLLLRWRWIR